MFWRFEPREFRGRWEEVVGGKLYDPKARDFTTALALYYAVVTRYPCEPCSFEALLGEPSKLLRTRDAAHCQGGITFQ